MAGSLTGYYGRAKAGIGNIDPKEMAQLGEDYMVVAATGAAVALAGTMVGGLDKEILGFPVPVDGLISVGLGVAGLSIGGDSGELLKVASIAAGGSAAVRTFESFFKKGFGVRGDFTEASEVAGLPGYQGTYGPTFAFGQGAQDRLVAAARFL
jgi:hypothetical protein